MVEDRRRQTPAPISGQGSGSEREGMGVLPIPSPQEGAGKKWGGELLAFECASILATTIGHGCYNDGDLQEEQWTSPFPHSKAKCL